MPSMAKQNKEMDWPYMNVDMAMALHHQNMSVGWGGIHHPGMWCSDARWCWASVICKHVS
jgi:hypothetical protein